MESTHVRQPLCFFSTIGRSFAEAIEKTLETLTGWLGVEVLEFELDIELSQAEVDADLGFGRD